MLHNKVTVEPLAFSSDITYIIKNARREDVEEFAAFDSHLDTLYDAADRADNAWLFLYKRVPAFVWGASRVHSDLWIWGAGTDDTRRIMPFATRWGLSRWLPDAFKDGSIQSIQALVPDTSDHSVRWLKSLGMRATPTLCSGLPPLVHLVYTRQDYEAKTRVLSPISNASGSFTGPNQVQRADTVRD